MRVLIVGLGSIGQRHVRNLRILLGDQVELMAVRVRGLNHILTDTLQVEAPDGLCEKYGIRAFGTLEQALAHKPEAAFICNPNSMHIGTALELARAGCHLFIEKPLADEFAGSTNSSGSWSGRAGRHGGYQFRFHPCLTTTNRLLESDAIGRVLAVRAQSASICLAGINMRTTAKPMLRVARMAAACSCADSRHGLPLLVFWFSAPDFYARWAPEQSGIRRGRCDEYAHAVRAGRLAVSSAPASGLCATAREAHVRDRWRYGKIETDLVGLTVRPYDASGQVAESNTFPAFNAINCLSRRPGVSWPLSRATNRL